MNRELDLTVEDLSTIAEYMRGDDPDKPVTVDMKYLKRRFHDKLAANFFTGDYVRAGAMEK
ncbi:TPA: hypothetical protein ACGRWC_000627 [Escherichia coli]